jgi:hypothetical protein
LWALAKVANQGVWINMGGKRVCRTRNAPELPPTIIITLLHNGLIRFSAAIDVTHTSPAYSLINHT